MPNENMPENNLSNEDLKRLIKKYEKQKQQQQMNEPMDTLQPPQQNMLFTYLLLGLVLTVIFLLILVLTKPTASPGQLSSLNQTVNKKLDSATNTMVSSFNISIGSFKNSSNLSVSAIYNAANAVRAAASSGSEGINQNVSSVSSTLSSIGSFQQSDTQGINSNLSRQNTTLAKVYQKLNQTYAKLGNITLSNSVWVPIWTSNYIIPAQGRYIGQFLNGYDNHLQFTASNQVTVTEFYITSLNTSNSMQTTWNNVGIIGPSTSMNFYFNQSSGCGSYLFVIQNQNRSNQTTIQPNQTVKYAASPSSTGVC